VSDPATQLPRYGSPVFIGIVLGLKIIKQINTEVILSIHIRKGFQVRLTCGVRNMRKHELPLPSGISPDQSHFVLETPTRPFRSVWRTCLYRFINYIYFQRITVNHPERLPKAGPVLYLGLHRNGAVDGFVYYRTLNAPVFMISTQLRKNWFARLFFDGIAVTRTNDEGDRNQNQEAMRQCLGHLRNGGQLFVFPEGTSSLGPKHLPFKSGGVWLLLDYLESGGPPLQVVPVGIHYECPWAFRAKVEVEVGHPISTEFPAEASRMELLKTMKRRVQIALEDVGINVASEEYHEKIKSLAYAATLGTSRSYFKSLKTMERAMPEKVAKEWEDLRLNNATLGFHQGVPLFPGTPILIYVLALAVISPIVLAAIVLNLPAFAMGWYAGKKFPDEPNVISLWKILAGAPAFALWVATITSTMLMLGRCGWLVAYAVVTWLGLKLYYPFKKLTVAVLNGFRHPDLRPKMLAFRQTLLCSIPDERD
jgi:1-acyl-sn-glycerol-3-phosphate acyltransferase